MSSQHQVRAISPGVLIKYAVLFFGQHMREFGRLITVPFFLFLLIYFADFFLRETSVAGLVGVLDMTLTVCVLPFVGVSWMRLVLGRSKVRLPFEPFKLNSKHFYYIWASLLIFAAQFPFLVPAYGLSLLVGQSSLLILLVTILLLGALYVGARLAFLSVFAALDRRLIMKTAWREGIIQWRGLFVILLLLRIVMFFGVLGVEKSLGEAGYPLTKLLLLTFSVLGDTMVAYCYKYRKGVKA